jgi:hypothetical protein
MVTKFRIEHQETHKYSNTNEIYFILLASALVVLEKLLVLRNEIWVYFRSGLVQMLPRVLQRLGSIYSLFFTTPYIQFSSREPHFHMPNFLLNHFSQNVLISQHLPKCAANEANTLSPDVTQK